jgi:hypothetical protein
MEFVIFATVIVGWLLLQIWILPKLGIRTCLSGGCCTPLMREGRNSTCPLPTVSAPPSPSALEK